MQAFETEATHKAEGVNLPVAGMGCLNLMLKRTVACKAQSFCALPMLNDVTAAFIFWSKC